MGFQVDQMNAANPFDYWPGREFNNESIDQQPNGLSPQVLLEPAVPTTMAEKQIVQTMNEYIDAAANVNAPPPPQMPVNWPRSPNQARIELRTAKSRTQLLSEARARG